MKYQRPHKLKYGKWGLIFILPFFIAYGIFNLYPLIMTFYNSFFSKYEDLFDTVVQFVGFDNYVKVFTEGQILKYFGNTFLLWLLGFIPQILISLLFASWFTDLRLKLKGTGAVKVILYLPNMLMASSVAVLFATLFAVTGPVNQLFGTAFNFLEDEWSIRLLIAFINFIMWTGNTTILLYVMVTSMIGGLQMFDIPNLLVKNGGPNEIAKTVVMDISNGISGSADVGFAATESVVLFFVAGIIGIFLFKLMESDDDKEARANKKAQKKALKNAKKGA